VDVVRRGIVVPCSFLTFSDGVNFEREVAIGERKKKERKGTGFGGRLIEYFVQIVQKGELIHGRKYGQAEKRRP